MRRRRCGGPRCAASEAAAAPGEREFAAASSVTSWERTTLAWSSRDARRILDNHRDRRLVDHRVPLNRAAMPLRTMSMGLRPKVYVRPPAPTGRSQIPRRCSQLRVWSRRSTSSSTSAACPRCAPAEAAPRARGDARAHRLALAAPAALAEAARRLGALARALHPVHPRPPPPRLLGRQHPRRPPPVVAHVLGDPAAAQRGRARHDALGDLLDAPRHRRPHRRGALRPPRRARRRVRQRAHRGDGEGDCARRLRGVGDVAAPAAAGARIVAVPTGGGGPSRSSSAAPPS